MSEGRGVDKDVDMESLSGDVKKTETVESLKGNLASNQGKAQLDYRESLQEKEVERLTQQKKLRKKFFKFCMILAYGIIGSNTIFFGWYIAWAREDVSTTVFQFWISATVVEILGIVAIIARYLFVDEHITKDAPSSPQPRFLTTRFPTSASRARQMLQSGSGGKLPPGTQKSTERNSRDV